MILFLKSTSDDGDNKMPLHAKLILMFKERVKEAEGDEGPGEGGAGSGEARRSQP
jgi:hypothetical protein